jgi:hypothetical protein
MLAGEERVKVKVRRCTGRNLEAAAELLGSVKIRWQAPGAAAAAIAMTERFARIVYSKRKYQRCLSSGRSMLSFNRAAKTKYHDQKIFIDYVYSCTRTCTAVHVAPCTLLYTYCAFVLPYNMHTRVPSYESCMYVATFVQLYESTKVLSYFRKYFRTLQCVVRNTEVLRVRVQLRVRK